MTYYIENYDVAMIGANILAFIVALVWIFMGAIISTGTVSAEAFLGWYFISVMADAVVAFAFTIVIILDMLWYMHQKKEKSGWL